MSEIFYNQINNLIITPSKKLIFLFLYVLSVQNFLLYGQESDSLVPVELFFSDGRLSSKGFMRNNKPDGYWITFYQNGVKKSEGNRLNYLLDGQWIFYDSTGNVTSVIEYVGGLKNGKLVNYENNSIKDSSIYVQDTIVGYKFIFSNNVLKSILPYRKGKENGEGFDFDETGQIITLNKYADGILIRQLKINRKNESGKLQGIYMSFYENYSLKTEGFYSNGLKNGLFKYYNLNGELIRTELWKNDVLVVDTTGAKVNFRKLYYPNSLIVQREGLYNSENIPIGRHNFFDENGTYVKSQIFGKNGVIQLEGILTESQERHGYWIEYYDNGNVRSRGEYEKGKKIGKWEYFYYNGNIEQVGEYKSDLPHGIWKTYCENGKLIKEGQYLNGRENGEFFEYTCEGDTIKKITYEEGYRSGEYILNINKNIEKGQYIDDLRIGKWYTYYEPEKIRTVTSFENDLENGKFLKYYYNGNLMISGQFINGKREGIWNFYDENGIRYLFVEYQNGNEIKYNGKKVNIR